MMLKKMMSCLTTFCGGVLIAASTHAATINFEVDTVTRSSVACSGLPSGDSNCNYGFTTSTANLLGSANDTVGTIVSLFTIVPQGNDRNDPFLLSGADSFTFTTFVNIIVQSVTYQFSALATVGNWSPTNASATGLNPQATLTWSNISNAAGAPFTVGFLTAGPFSVATGSLPVDIRIKALQPAVVPLPAGVLLLGTALLGLFGLSRRRKLAAA